jgi:hypothetical protein
LGDALPQANDARESVDDSKTSARPARYQQAAIIRAKI